jgi:hypothetical protein
MCLCAKRPAGDSHGRCLPRDQERLGKDTAMKSVSLKGASTRYLSAKLGREDGMRGLALYGLRAELESLCAANTVRNTSYLAVIESNRASATQIAPRRLNVDVYSNFVSSCPSLLLRRAEETANVSLSIQNTWKSRLWS